MPYRGQRLAGVRGGATTRAIVARSYWPRAGASCVAPKSGQQQELQALCLECHRTKTSLKGNHSTTLESRFSRYAYQNYAASPRFRWSSSFRSGTTRALARAAKKRLGQRSLPLPVFCPLDCIVPTKKGKLADLSWVVLPCDHCKGVLDRLPCVGLVFQARLHARGRARQVAALQVKWSLDVLGPEINSGSGVSRFSRRRTRRSPTRPGRSCRRTHARSKLRHTQKVRISAGKTPLCCQFSGQMELKFSRTPCSGSFRSSAICLGTQSMSWRSSKALARIWSPAKS